MLSVQEAAELKAVDPSSIRRALYRGDLKGVQKSGVWIIQQRDLDAWTPERRGRKRQPSQAAA